MAMSASTICSMATEERSTAERTLEWFKGEVGRRLVHSSGAFPLVLYLTGLLSWPQTAGLFVLGAAVALVLELLRLYGNLELWVHEHLTREYEQDSFAGYLMYMVAAAAVVVAFDPTIAVPAVLMLAVADPLSGIASSGELRRIKRPRALATMFLVSAGIAAAFLYETPLAVVLGGLGAMVADGVKPQINGYIIDDNLTIPIVAALAMQLGIELMAL